MRESLRPALAAAEAAPIRKLCPLNRDASNPATINACRKECTRRGRESEEPSLKMKSGPRVVGLMARYARTAETGQRISCVRPK